MSEGDRAKVCSQSVDRGEKLMVHPWSIVRIKAYGASMVCCENYASS